MAAYRTSWAGGGTSGSSNRTCSVTAPTVGDLLIVVCGASGNNVDTPTCADNQGGTYSRILAAAKNASADRLSVFVRDQLVTTTTTHTVTVSTGSNTAAEIVVIAYSDVAKVGSEAVRSFGSQANQAAGGTPAPSLNQNALTGNPTICGVFNASAAGSVLVPNADWTERRDVAQTTPTTGVEVATRDSGFTGTTITAGGTSSTAFASFAIELDTAVDATGNGTTLSDTASLIEGAAQADSQGAGTTLTGTASLLAGAGQVSATAEGVTLSDVSSLIAGEGQAASTASGTTLTQTATLIAGMGVGQVDGQAEGAVVSATASLLAGAGQAESQAEGGLLTGTVSFSPGAGSSEGTQVDDQADGQLLSVTASMVAGAASVDGTGSGVTLTVAATLLPGAVQVDASVSGLQMSANSSLLAGEASVETLVGSALFEASVVFLPGVVVGDVVASGATLTAGATLTMGTLVAFLPSRRSTVLHDRQPVTTVTDVSESTLLYDSRLYAA